MQVIIESSLRSRANGFALLLLWISCSISIYRLGTENGRRSIRRSQCILETCSDDWSATPGVIEVNQDTSGCSVMRSMLIMNQTKENLTGIWCKVFRAYQQCERQTYKYFAYRDDDTIFDLNKALQVARESEAAVVASYRDSSRKIVTNWFVLDLASQSVCDSVKRWWESAEGGEEGVDQKSFNEFFSCDTANVVCLDKKDNFVDEVHCGPNLGGYHSFERQKCLRYEAKPNKMFI